MKPLELACYKSTGISPLTSPLCYKSTDRTFCITVTDMEWPWLDAHRLPRVEDGQTEVALQSLDEWSLDQTRSHSSKNELCAK